MKSRRGNGLPRRHPEIHDVGHGLHHRRDDPRAARAPEHVRRLPILLDDRRAHRGERPLARRDRVGGALHQPEQIGRPRLYGEIVHLVIEEKPGARRHHPRAKISVERVGDGDRIPFSIDDRIMRCLGLLVRRAARVEFGGVERVRDECREARGLRCFDDLRGDLRYAARMLARNPGFTCVAVLSLALGIGANTAIFSLVNAVLLKTLPVSHPERLFFVDNTGGKSRGANAPPYPCYERLRDHNRYFSGIAAFDAVRLKVTIDGVQEQISGQYASGDYFPVLGLRPAYGRLLTPSDDSVPGRGGQEGASAVISYGFWQRRFGKSPGVLGKKIRLGTTANWVTIVGVTPPEFFGF